MLKNTLQNKQNIDTFKQLLKNKYINVFEKFKKNKLILSIIYAFNLLSDEKLNIFYKLFQNSQKKNINESISFDIILSSLLCYLSFIISYSFEHMLNKCTNNGKPCMHIIYGETISQLASFCIFVEGNNIILRNNQMTNKIKNKIIRNFHELNTTQKQLSNLLQHINQENKKELLQNDLKNKLEKIVGVTIENLLLL